MAATTIEMMNAMMFPTPIAPAMSPPTTAPTIPTRIVRMMPIGLRPGITKRARTPMTAPMMMYQRTVSTMVCGPPSCRPPGSGGSDSRWICPGFRSSFRNYRLKAPETDVSRLGLADLDVRELRGGHDHAASALGVEREDALVLGDRLADRAFHPVA